MISGLSPRSGSSQLRNSNFKNENSITFAQENAPKNPNQHYSFSQVLNSPQSTYPLSPNLSSQHFENKFISFGSQSWLENKKNQETSISLSDMVKKLQKTYFDFLYSQYGAPFSQNSSYSQWIAQMKNQDSIDKVIYTYTSILASVIQAQQKRRIKSPSNFQHIVLDKAQRLKLKLILTQEEENQINKFKSKGLQGYTKKIQDQNERYKKQHIRIKDRNRVLQGQLLKLALDFKNKRELYITEISRLTEILHSSFMQVGKMFVSIPNSKNFSYSQDSEIKYEPRAKNVSAVSRAVPSNRKNFKSLSPYKNTDGLDFVKQEQKLPDFIKPPVKSTSNYESYLKPESVINSKKNKEPSFEQNKYERPFEAESESAIKQKKRSQVKSPSLMLSASNFSREDQIF